MKNIFLRDIFTINSNENVQNALHLMKRSKTHILIVRDVVKNGLKDPFYLPVGIITMEDIIEALIQEEIQDEHDYEREYTIRPAKMINDFLSNYIANSVLNPNEIAAVSEFLSKYCSPFKRKFISSRNLKELVKSSSLIALDGSEDPNAEILNENNDEVSSKFLCVNGEACKYFYLVISGRVQIVFGNEKIQCFLGSYDFLGVKALENPRNEYVPDFSATVIGKNYLEPTRLLRISQDSYINFTEEE